MTEIYQIIIILVFSYLIGSIPFGLIMGSIYGINIQKEGSGNIGATNVFRTLGPTAGIVVMILDVGKGFAAVYAVKLFGNAIPQGIPVLACASVVLGHIFSPFLKMSGGKGVATATGALIALVPKIAILLIISWILILFLTRYVSVASIASASIFPLLVILSKKGIYELILSIFVAVFIIFTHRSNIKRLFDGTENKFYWKKN